MKSLEVSDQLPDTDFFKRIINGLLLAKLPFSLQAAVIFGSRVKNKETEESDVDLLIVADRINAKLHRRGEEIALIKKNLFPFPFDILLYTIDEVISNFRNHNPLFLDIAVEGIILFDKTGLIENLVTETRRYIRKKGIKKLSDGWVFPVQKGKASLLSKISNRDFSLAMLQDGQRDFTIGQKLVEEKFYDKAVYHFQQAVEKGIKSILITIGVFKKTHFVGEVLRVYVQKKKLPRKWEKDMLEAAKISEDIEPEVSLSRYPGIIDDSLWLPSREYEELDAKNAMAKAEKVLDIASKFTSDWFSSPRRGICPGSKSG